MTDFQDYQLDFSAAIDPALQAAVERTDLSLRQRLGIDAERTAVGVLDLKTLRLAMVRPDAIEYAASVPKIAILLAWFELNPSAATDLDAATRREFELMIKQSNNELAAKHSQALGLKRIQDVLISRGFYDAQRGGGLWVGKHYGNGGERHGDPVANHSHAATVRQLLRFYLALEQGRLVSTPASQTMREIFDAPNVPHLDDKFVKGLAGRGAHLRRKSGWWEDWFHDSAVVTGGGRHYIVVALTHHPRGEEYLVEFARAVDDLMTTGQ